MEFNGIVCLTLVTSPELITIKNNNGGTTEFYQLTLSDGKVIFNRVSGDRNYDFTKLTVGVKYPFAIMPRVKNITAVANNGNQYNKAYNDFKVVGVVCNDDLKNFVGQNFTK